jgi:antitoxin component of RelBE/YafQ-DinJ toxin-antitoxin module
MMKIVVQIRVVQDVKKKAMQREIRMLTEENQQLRRYTLLTSLGITLSLAIGLVKVIRNH